MSESNAIEHDASEASPTQAQIEARIARFLEELGVDARELTPSVDLFERGLVDSVGVIELLAFLEGEYGVEIPEDDLLSGDFSRIDGIAGIVARLAAGG